MDMLVDYIMISYEGQNIGKIYLTFLHGSGDDILEYGDKLILSKSQAVIADIKSGTIRYFAQNPIDNPSLVLYKFVPYKF